MTTWPGHSVIWWSKLNKVRWPAHAPTSAGAYMEANTAAFISVVKVPKCTLWLHSNRQLGFDFPFLFSFGKPVGRMDPQTPQG